MSSANLYTVAAIRKSADGKTTEYLFNESARIFELGTTVIKDRKAIETISGALARKTPVKLAIDESRDLVNMIAEPAGAEVLKFRQMAAMLENPSRPRAIELDKIDYSRFDMIDYSLKHPVFPLCTKIVPSYAKAREIFDYCAQQSCNLPGPYDVNPCIPFQYVRDGCFARAHKMRWIITTRYRYCCEKVFSFANSGNDTLAVQATKWGGCCVRWWYHVAPLIRVKVTLRLPTRLNLTRKSFSFNLAYVIDPGMFNQPVLLSTWLGAQANAVCAPNANVSMYSIQPGSAYTPANYAGTQYTTDSNYAATDAALNFYKNMQTCP